MLEHTFKMHIITSSFSWSIMWALRLATLENFLLHTGQVGSSPLCVHLCNVRLNSTLNDIGHWSHRWGYLGGKRQYLSLIPPLRRPFKRQKSQYYDCNLPCKHQHWKCTYKLKQITTEVQRGANQISWMHPHNDMPFSPLTFSLIYLLYLYAAIMIMD